MSRILYEHFIPNQHGEHQFPCIRQFKKYVRHISWILIFGEIFGVNVIIDWTCSIGIITHCIVLSLLSLEALFDQITPLS